MRILTLFFGVLLLSSCGVYRNQVLPPLVPITESLQLHSESFVFGGPKDILGAILNESEDGTVAVLLSPYQITTFINDSFVNKASLKHPATSKPVLDAGMVYFTNSAGELVAFNARTGSIEWRVTLDSPLASAPVVGKQNIYLQAQNGYVYAVSKTTREIKWQQARKTPILAIETNSQPYLANGTLYVGFSDGYLVAMNANSGEVEWERRIASPQGRSEIARLIAVNTPIVYDNTLIVTSYHGYLTRMSMNGSHTFWKEKVSSKEGALLIGDYLLIQDDKNNLQAFSVADGSLAWHQPLLRQRKAKILANTQEHVLLGDGYGMVHLLRLNDGELVGRIALEESASFHFPALWKNENIYTVSSKGTFHHLIIKEAEIKSAEESGTSS